MERNNLFAAALENESHWTLTENGERALNTTGEDCLDLFATIGSLRDAHEIRVYRLFEDAYREDPLTATKIMFYARDIRGGLGERKTFRYLLHYNATVHPECIEPNIPLIGFYGRFDDLYSLIGTKLEDKMWAYMKSMILTDLELMESGLSCSLLAKWIKTPDASSKNTRALGILTAKKLGYSVYEFKRILRKLRRYIDVTEVKMSQNRWSEIDYSAVPSRAMSLYRSAFPKHDFERFSQYLEKVSSGEEKINASTLYPYDLVEKVYKSGYGEDPVVEAQWKALPEYVEPGTNAIVVADTSGSMMCSNGRPLYSALGLAVYFAEHNTGAFNNLFMSFSSKSTMHEIKGSTLAQKLSSINMDDWGGSTNCEASFENVLNIALKYHIPESEMVKSIIIISDMEFNRCDGDDWAGDGWTFYDKMKAKYKSYGYEIPNIIFWNVNSRNDVFHADSTKKGVQLVSGQSASTFKNLVGCIGMTPVEMMQKVIGDARYNLIKVLES